MKPSNATGGVDIAHAFEARRPLASVVVNNHNYGRFLQEAIDSALAQTYRPLEVVVVDDGSTDDSRAVIAAYGERIVPVLKENGGQASALNAGFASCHGDVVIFLDADDVLLPETVAHAVDGLSRMPAAAKLMYRMRVVDTQGCPTGALKPAPHLQVPTGDLRREMMTFAFDIPRTATSANAFPRDLLRQIMPIPEDDLGSTGADWYLVHVGALYGEVAFLDFIGANYRVHSDNSFEREATAIDVEQLRRTVGYADTTGTYLQYHATKLGLCGLAPLCDGSASFSIQGLRLILWKLDAAAGREGSLVDLVVSGMQSAHKRSDLRPVMRLMLAAWYLALALSPTILARRLALSFVYPERRMRANRILGWLHR